MRRSLVELLVDLKGVDSRLIAAIVEAVKAHSSPEAAGIDLPTIAELWAEWEPVAKKLRSWRVCRTHGRNFARIPVTLEGGRRATLFSLPWNEMTTHAADLYRQTRSTMASGRRGRDGKIGNVTDSTINRELITMQTMLAYFRDVKKSIHYSPLDGFRRVNEAGSARQTYLTPEQAKRFIEAGPPMWQDICTVAYRCAGMRHSEARLLKKSEVDWEACCINLPSRRNKNAIARVIPFPDDVLAILKRHSEISRGPYVFVSTKDPKRMDPVGPSAMQYWMEKARERSGIVGFDGESVVVHSLRHAGVTRLVESGVQESFIKAAAGMSDETFKRYVKFKRPQQELLRRHMNRLALPSDPPPPAPPPPPTPLTAQLQGERHRPRRAQSGPPGAKRRTLADEI